MQLAHPPSGHPQSPVLHRCEVHGAGRAGPCGAVRAEWRGWEGTAVRKGGVKGEDQLLSSGPVWAMMLHLVLLFNLGLLTIY